MGELTAGVVEVELSDSQIPLSGPNSVVGRAFVIHELEDDLGKGKHHKEMPCLSVLLQSNFIVRKKWKSLSKAFCVSFTYIAVIDFVL